MQEPAPPHRAHPHTASSRSTRPLPACLWPQRQLQLRLAPRRQPHAARSSTHPPTLRQRARLVQPARSLQQHPPSVSVPVLSSTTALTLASFSSTSPPPRSRSPLRAPAGTWAVATGVEEASAGPCGTCGQVRDCGGAAGALCAPLQPRDQ